MNKFNDDMASFGSIKNNQKIGEQPHKSVAHKTKKISAKRYEEQTEDNFKHLHGYNRSASKNHFLMQFTSQ